MSAVITSADLSVAEMAALNLLLPNGVARLNAYWDRVYAMPENVFRGDEPSRLSESGAAWWADLSARYLAAGGSMAPAPVAQPLAREVLRTLGTLTVLNA